MNTMILSKKDCILLLLKRSFLINSCYDYDDCECYFDFVIKRRSRYILGTNDKKTLIFTFLSHNSYQLTVKK